MNPVRLLMMLLTIGWHAGDANGTYTMTAAHSAAAPLQELPGSLDADAGADQMDSAQPKASSKRLHEGMNESEAVASGEQHLKTSPQGWFRKQDPLNQGWLACLNAPKFCKFLVGALHRPADHHILWVARPQGKVIQTVSST